MIGGNEAARLYVSVSADIRSAMTNMQTVDRQVDQSAALVRRTNPILQGLGQGLGLAAIGSAALATKAVTDLALASVTAASDLREAVTLTDQVFEANSTAMQDWATGAAGAFGQSQREALNYAAGFGTAFKNVGIDLDETSEKSRELTRLADDLGSAFNRGSDEAATALRSGLIGETEPMRRFGVFLSEAAVAAKAVQLGIARAGQEMSDAQKVAARYAIIMEQTADSQGMFGRDSESLADAQKALGAELENLGAEVGETLIPMFVDVAQTLRTETIPEIRNFLGSVAEAIQPLIDLENASREAFDELGRINTFNPRSVSEGIGPGLTDVAGQWLGIIPSDAWSKAMVEMETSGARMASRTTGDLASIRSSMGLLGADAYVMASDVRISNADIVASFGAMRDRLSGSASAAADAIYGPLIAKGQLAATEREIAEQREIVAARDSTAAQVADAKLRMDELSAMRIEQLALLASYGDQAALETLSAMKEIHEALQTGTDEQIANILVLMRQLNLLKLAALEAAGALNFTSGGAAQGDRATGPGFSGARAGGGPVRKDDVYMVGEEGREAFVPWTNGSIIPNDELARGDRSEMQVPAMQGGSYGSGGGTTVINVTVTSPLVFDPYGAAAQQLAEALQPSLGRADTRNGV